MHTVGAGGGSLAWRDTGGALRVGPQSAGADPGPACYGRGGELPRSRTRTCSSAAFPTGSPGGLELDRDAAERAPGGVGAEPEDVIEVVNAEMLAALRVVSVERGLDPRDFALVAFGGAGALHACALADELGDRHRPRPRRGRRALGARAGRSATSGATGRSLVVPLDQAGELPAEGEADLRYAGSPSS